MSRKIISIPHFFNNLTYNRRYFWSFLTKIMQTRPASMEITTVFTAFSRNIIFLDTEQKNEYNIIDSYRRNKCGIRKEHSI